MDVVYSVLITVLGSLFQTWQNEEMSVTGPKIPQALEKILQLKEIRQEQLTDPAGQSSYGVTAWRNHVKDVQLESLYRQPLTFTFPFTEEEDDEGADMDMNNSSGLVMSETEDDDSQLSKKDVSLLDTASRIGCFCATNKIIRDGYWNSVYEVMI